MRVQNLPLRANLRVFVSASPAFILCVYEKDIQHSAETSVPQMGQANVLQFYQTPGLQLSGEDRQSYRDAS